MAAPVCTKAALLQEAVCYGGCTFNTHEQLALEVYARMQTLAAIGGTNYVNDEDTLAIDANNLFGQVENAQRREMQLAILLNNADASGAAISADPNTLKGFIKVLAHYDDAMLQAMNLLLQCQTGASKDYPQ